MDTMRRTSELRALTRVVKGKAFQIDFSEAERRVAEALTSGPRSAETDRREARMLAEQRWWLSEQAARLTRRLVQDGLA